MDANNKPSRWETVLLIVVTLFLLGLVACFGAAGVIAAVAGAFAFFSAHLVVGGFNFVSKKWNDRKKR